MLYPTKGFTIIELIVVVSLMAILTTGAVLLVRDMRPNVELANTVRGLQINMARARALAMAEQKTHGLSFNEWQGTYTLIRIDGATTVIENYALPKNYYFSDGLPFTTDAITFDSLGAPSTSGAIVIEYTNGKKKTLTLTPAGYTTISQ